MDLPRASKIIIDLVEIWPPHLVESRRKATLGWPSRLLKRSTTLGHEEIRTCLSVDEEMVTILRWVSGPHLGLKSGSI